MASEDLTFNILPKSEAESLGKFSRWVARRLGMAEHEILQVCRTVDGMAVQTHDGTWTVITDDDQLVFCGQVEPEPLPAVTPSVDEDAPAEPEPEPEPEPAPRGRRKGA